MLGLVQKKSEFGWEFNCEKEGCTNSFAFGGRSHCRQCRKAFCQKHIHTNDNVDKKCKLFKMCENCKDRLDSVDISTINLNDSSSNSSDVATSVVTNSSSNEDGEDDSVWEKGKRLFNDM